MADSKISALPSATTPLAGTEVLPIVQSGVTDKITVNSLAAGNLKSQSTTGVLQVSGPSAAATRVMTVPDANFTAARTDAAQSFTGDQTLGTGNLIQGTSAKGVNFTANTPKAGMTSQLLNWYEEGTWTPTVAGAAITVSSATYTRIGRMVSLAFDITWPTTSDTSNITVASFPFSAIANSGSLVLGYTDSTTHRPNGAASGTGVVFFGKSGSPSTQITNADLSGKRVIASISYFTS